jgi:ABC-type uncharacterized transport system permease subunit
MSLRLQINSAITTLMLPFIGTLVVKAVDDLSRSIGSP